MAPRIGIPVPTSRDLEYNRRSWPQYASAVERSGGAAVKLELRSPSQLRNNAATCDGFILPGSPADVQPGRYGQELDPITSPADLPREECDDFLLDEADKLGKPVLGICFGLQSMNVWSGGSLVQDVAPLPVNHSAGREVAIAHTVLVAADTVLASILARTEVVPEGAFFRLPVNTSHHQAVAAPGTGFRIVARCPEDGVIEAVERPFGTGVSGDESFLLGVQWHPERSFDLSATSRALFVRLVHEAQTWAAKAAAVAVS